MKDIFHYGGVLRPLITKLKKKTKQKQNVCSSLTLSSLPATHPLPPLVRVWDDLTGQTSLGTKASAQADNQILQWQFSSVKS